MNKWAFFGGGFVLGVILTFAVLYFVGTAYQQQQQQEEDNQTTMFEEPGDVIDVKSFKVIQVVDKGTALAYGEANDLSDYYGGTVYKLTNDEGKYYYDGEIVKVTKGLVAKQIGIFKYNSALGPKTVPIVRIMNE